MKKNFDKMTTRSRTILFLHFRNSHSQGRNQKFHPIDAEQLGLMDEVAVEMSTLPPQWVDIVEEIQLLFTTINEKSNFD
jgi:hypothetical protein